MTTMMHYKLLGVHALVKDRNKLCIASYFEEVLYQQQTKIKSDDKDFINLLNIILKTRNEVSFIG